MAGIVDLREGPAAAGSPHRAGYDAFVSYSHAADGSLAPMLQRQMQTIGKPWYRRRTLRVFRDETSLAATPELWPTIVRALEQSRYFILLASRDAAHSAWVEREVAWWRAHRAAGTLLIVVTAGELVWDPTVGDFSASSSVPASARGWLADEPLWVDLRWAREEDQLSTRNPRFRDAAACLVAPIRGVDRDEVVGEDIRQHRRTMRLARGAVAMLAALSVAAVIGGVVADTQRRRAEDRLSQAQSLALASSATVRLTSRPDVALALAYEAYRELPGVQARSAVIRALAATQASGRRGLLNVDDPLEALAWSPDGKTLVTGGWNGRVRSWNAATRAPLGSFNARQGRVHEIAFSPDGRMFASIGDDLRLWDSTTHNRLARLQQTLNAVTFSHDGTLFATGGDSGVVSLWDASRLTSVARFSGHKGAVEALAFSPDDRTLASTGDDATIRLWSLAKHRQRALLRLSSGLNTGLALAFNSHGHELASGDINGTVEIWNTGTRIRRARLTGNRAPVYDLAYGPDGRTLASAGDDGSVRTWSAETRRPLAVLEDHVEPVHTVAFSPDGRSLASAGADGTVRFWDPANRTAFDRGTERRVTLQATAFTPNAEMLATASQGGTVQIRRLTSPAPFARVFQPWASLSDILFSPDASIVALVNDTVRLWRPRGRGPSTPLRTPGGEWAESAALSPDAKTLATGGEHGTIWLWDVQKRSPIAHFKAARTPINALAFSINGKTLASGGYDTAIQLWNTVTRRRVARLQGHISTVLTMAFSPNGSTLASASADTTVRLWNAVTHTQIARLTGHRGWVSVLSFSPDGRTLATAGSDGTIRLWDPADGALLASLPGPGADVGVGALTFSKDGRTLLAADGQGTVRRWRDLLWRNIRELHTTVCARLLTGLTATDWRQYAQGIPYRRSCR